MSAFQRYLVSNNSNEIDGYSLSELRSADEQFGRRDIDEGFRIAIRNKIRDLELTDARRYESKVRIGNLLTGILIGILIGVVLMVIEHFFYSS